MFMILPFTLFFGISVVLLPIAYFLGIADKYNAIKVSKLLNKSKLYINLAIFLFFCPLILIFDFLVGDIYYFWMNSFRRDLKKCVIKKEIASVSHRSLKQIMNMANKYNEHKVDSMYSNTVISNFRRKLKVKANIQFLFLGQWIPNGGFKKESKTKAGGANIQSKQTFAT